MSTEYPGKGRPWPDFLHHRARVLAEFRDAGKTYQEICDVMEMDPVQVQLIVMTVDDYPETYGRPAKKGAPKR